jgi:hypothetical protein
VTPVRWKQPDEVRTITFDFTSKLLPGDTVASIVALVAPGLTVAGTVLTNNKVTALLSGGALDTTVRVSCRVTTTPGGETLELDCDVEVLDGAN